MNKVRNRNKVSDKVKSHTKNHIDMQDNKIGSDHKSTAYNSQRDINRFS